MTANVLTPNREADKLIQIVQESTPDILLTLESDTWWEQQLSVLEGDYPHTVKCPRDNLYGMHLYSKLPLDRTQIKYLIEDDKPSIHCLATLPSGTKIRFHFLHPAPPSPTENEESSERDAELLVVAKAVAQADAREPIIVAGDLNDVAWSKTTRAFRRLSGLLDPRIGRGMFNTFHAHHWFLRWPLDHLFHSKHFTLTRIRRSRYYGSDHFALITELAYDPGETGQESFLERNGETLDWANRKAKEENVSAGDVPF